MSMILGDDPDPLLGKAPKDLNHQIVSRKDARPPSSNESIAPYRTTGTEVEGHFTSKETERKNEPLSWWCREGDKVVPFLCQEERKRAQEYEKKEKV
jgi:hypothetical protein